MPLPCCGCFPRRWRCPKRKMGRAYTRPTTGTAKRPEKNAFGTPRLGRASSAAFSSNLAVSWWISSRSDAKSLWLLKCRCCLYLIRVCRTGGSVSTTEPLRQVVCVRSGAGIQGGSENRIAVSAPHSTEPVKKSRMRFSSFTLSLSTTSGPSAAYTLFKAR